MKHVEDVLSNRGLPKGYEKMGAQHPIITLIRRLNRRSAPDVKAGKALNRRKWLLSHTKHEIRRLERARRWHCCGRPITTTIVEYDGRGDFIFVQCDICRIAAKIYN